MDGDPWLQIPANDYEAHMRAAGQDRPLREIFAGVVADARPKRVAVLGCSTGADLAQLDPAATELAVAVDINPEYLEVARTHAAPLGERVQFVCADIAVAELPPGGYDLIHAALLLEYVSPEVLFAKVYDWLAPAGMLSLVIQEPAEGLPAVTETGVDSLRALTSRMTLRTGSEVTSLAAKAGFGTERRRTVSLPSGKKLTGILFEKVRPSLDRRRGRARC